jgi:peptidoglycan-associated lipoprotein
MRNIKIFVFIISGMLLLSACSSTVKLNEEIADKGNLPPESVIRPCCINPNDLTKPHDDPSNILAKRSIYFDFDGYSVNDEFKPLVQAHAKYLAMHKELQVIIVGNTDERGGREYNLALGHKRAEAVRFLFALFGVPEVQMEAITYGAEKPKAEGSNEAAWAENRRADIVYK